MIEPNDLPNAAGISAEEFDLLELLLEDEGFAVPGPQQILATDDRANLPLSFAQQRLWFLDQLEPGNAAYNIPAAVRLEGHLDVAALERTLNEIVRRHEVLRTVFIADSGQPRQLVREHLPESFALEDLSGLPEAEREIGLRARIEAEARRPFDLAQGPVLRSSLLRLGEEEHVLLLTMHHIASDAWSAGVFVKEMGALYEAYVEGRESPLAELPVQYADYARWQRELLQGEALEQQLQYWREQLAGAPPVLELPTDRPRPALQTFRGERLAFALGPELTERLRELSRREGATLFMTLLAGFAALLSRYSGQEEVVVGTPIAGRTRSEVEGLIGFFVNTLALRADLTGDPTFGELLKRARETCLGAYQHQEVPFEKLVEELQPERSLTHTPLFQVCLVLQNASIPELHLRGLKLKPLEIESVTAKFDLTLMLSERGGGLEGSIDYRTDLFDAATIRRMASHLERLLTGVAAEPDLPISALPLLSEDERLVQLRDWNAAKVDYPPLVCVHQLFERWAAATPDAVAVAGEDGELTYGELNQRAEHLAWHLRRHGVGRESRVALLMNRGTELVAALLAVLKTGGAYVPLDPAYPLERLLFMLEDSGAAVLLTHEGLGEELGGVARLVDVSEAWRLAEGEGSGKAEAAELASGATPENLAYVIYTSGSTGRPKGVMVTHANVSRLLAATNHWFGFGPSDVWTLFHSYAFDFSVWEIWGALCYGGRLEVVPYWVSRSPEEFHRLLAERRVTVLNQTPSAFRQLAAVADGAELSLRWVIFGGEALDARWVRGWLGRPGAPTLVNMYGITETTVHVSYRRVEDADAEAVAGGVIGRRIPDLQVYVLDARMEPAPLGVSGELYIGGAGLARGYLSRPGLTAERFVPHPFSGEPGARLYRTGDVGRYRADGELEYLGRCDQQVKVRGFRIELGEIEATLGLHPGVKEALVLASGDGGTDTRLVAYVVGVVGEGNGSAPRAGELREHLLTRLPEHMVPSAFVMMDQLPLTPNGKVDRRALPTPGQGMATAEETYVAPRTPVEEILCVIWSEVLGVERVGVEDNFFELGGDSIRSVRVLALAREKGLQLSLQQLFQRQTISALASELELAQASEAPAADTAPFALISEADRAKIPAHIEDAYPLARMQAGMLFHMELMPGSPLYHNVNSWPLRTPFDADALQAAVQRVVARHAIFRTSFDLTTYSEPLQLVHPEAHLPVKTEDLRHLSVPEREKAVTAYVESEKGRRFDSSRPPLLRFHVHRLTDEVFQFTLTEFHPILDGWSLQSTLTEIFNAYLALLEGRELPAEPPLLTTYRDFVMLERQALESSEQKEFWARHLSDHVPTVLPRWPGSERGGTSSRVRRQRIRIPASVLDGLQGLAHQAGVPLKSVLLAAHLKVLSLASGRAEVLTGLVSNGRPEKIDGESVRGLFLNTLPFRLDLGDATWLELARSTFAAERELLPFRRYPLAALQENSRESLFETSFNYVHFHVLEGVLGAGRIEAADSAGHASEETNFTLDASFSLSPATAQLTLTLDCDATQLCDAQTEAIGKYYRNVFDAIVADPSARHDARSLLEPEELNVLARGNDTGRDYDLGLCVHELFERQAQRTPAALAAVGEDGQLTYGELNEKSDRLARHLRRHGVGPESRVALLLKRGVEMVAALLGVLKAGAAYVPLDPTYPHERLSFMLEDSGARVLLTHGDVGEALRGRGGAPGAQGLRVVDVSEVWTQTEGVSDELRAESFAAAARPENLAYVIYTSGSTGNPKGVLIQHRSLSNYTQAAIEGFGLKPEDKVLQFASISFDTAAEEIYPCLAAGATLVLRDERMLDTTETFLEKLLDYGITVLDLPTAYWHHLTLDLATKSLTMPAGLRLLIIGGEEALAERLDQWRGLGFDGVQLVNSYGPTEATIVATTFDLTAPSKAGGMSAGISTKASYIGSPVPNVRTHLLDARLQPVPIGVAGELYIGGDGLARGYLNQPALTAERFIPDPFSPEPGRRLYRSGDLARYLPDGTIEYLGRADQQVKIRGYRIELGEVESVLCEHAAVREAVALAREDVPGDRRLVAYVTSAVTSAAGAQAVPAELRAHLRERLPEYMVPTAFVVMDQWPRLPNGKLDRRALPPPEAVADDVLYEPPRTPVEEVLCGIWAEVLGLPRVGVNDNFFDLGGHSLKLLQAHSKIRERLGPVVSLVDMFQYSTVSAMAAYLNRQERDEPSTESELRMQERAGKRRQVAVRYKQLRREQGNPHE
jgi:amino acid adenylation domain-containing protein